MLKMNSIYGQDEWVEKHYLFELLFKIIRNCHYVLS